MKKFVAMYYGSAEAMQKMSQQSDSEKEEMMGKWFAWKEKAGDHLVDFGAPFMPGHALDSVAENKDPQKVITGFSILQGESLEQVSALFDTHPHKGAGIDLFECISM